MAFFLCDVIGDGLTPETAFRPAAHDHVGSNFKLAVDGRIDPTATATKRMIVECEESGPLIADSRCQMLTVGQIVSTLAQSGAPAGDVNTLGEGMRRLVMRFRVAAWLGSDDFGALTDTFGDLPSQTRANIEAKLAARGVSNAWPLQSLQDASLEDIWSQIGHKETFAADIE